MSGVRWPELPDHLKGRIAPDSIAPQKPRADLATKAPAPAPSKNAGKKARRRSEESDMSMEVAKWRDDLLELKALNPHPEVRWFHAIPNGSNRGKAAAGRAKGEGQLSGVLDWFLPVMRLQLLQQDALFTRHRVWSGFYIELKLPVYRNSENGGLKPKQAEFRDFVVQQGYKVAVCYSSSEVIDLVVEYLKLPKPGGG